MIIGGSDSHRSSPSAGSGGTGDRQVTTAFGGGDSEKLAGFGDSRRTDGAGETASIILLGTAAFTTTASDTTRPAGLDRHKVFFMREVGSWGKSLPNPG